MGLRPSWERSQKSSKTPNLRRGETQSTRHGERWALDALEAQVQGSGCRVQGLGLGL